MRNTLYIWSTTTNYEVLSCGTVHYRMLHKFIAMKCNLQVGFMLLTKLRMQVGVARSGVLTAVLLKIQVL